MTSGREIDRLRPVKGDNGGVGAAQDGVGGIFRLFRSYPDGLTKSDVVRLSGLSRTTVNQRLEPLLAAGLLMPAAEEARTGGRPADRFVVNESRGVVLVADMGASGLRAALCDMAATVRAERYAASDITDGPLAVLGRVHALFTDMLAEVDRTPENVCGIGVDVPGPVDHETGRVVSPPIMTGWHNYDIPGYFGPHFDAPVVVEKDVNAMAFGEQRVAHPDARDLVFVKVGTGIGTGIIAAGEIYRGADGAAGDVGHTQLTHDGDQGGPTCRCGKLGCVEAFAGGWALQRDLQELGLDVPTVGAAVQLTRDRHPDAMRLFTSAAAVVGAALSDLVNVLNPRTLVLGGQLAAVDDMLFAGVREAVYRRSLPLATRKLEIVPSTLAEKAGVWGLARLVIDHVYAPARVEALVAGGR